MNEMQQAFDIIRQQQAKLPEYSPAVMVGHQLMDLLKMQPEAAGFVLHDLQGKGMGIADCEQRIEAWADEHKKGGSCVCVPPDTAEQIIRKFYGIPAPEETKQRALGLAINLADFFIRGRRAVIKNDDLLALPRAAKPAKAMRAAQEHARPCTAPGVICAKVHETADGPVLALDLWARGGLYAREFFDGQGKRRVFFGRTAHQRQRAFFKAAGCHTLAWASWQTENAWRRFFNIPRGITRGAEEMIFLAEHGRRGADGTFTASGAGNAGGYAPEELFFRTGCRRDGSSTCRNADLKQGTFC